MGYETVIYQKEKGIATLTFNRPEVMNALNLQMFAELRSAIDEARDDDEVRVLIVTGAGRGFQAGEDVKEIQLAKDRDRLLAERELTYLKGTDGSLHLEEFYKPVIATVNGAAVGMGLTIALCCDVRIASEDASFGYAYVLRNLAGGAFALVRLTQIVGLSKALEMMLSGEVIDAAEAERIGLVSKIVPRERLVDEAKALARKIMKGAPLAQQVIKRAVHKAMFNPSALDDFMRSMNQALEKTEDLAEGAKAFAEKREPEYKGR
jgi:enoyl-CoA hydratase/carnithine racemase